MARVKNLNLKGQKLSFKRSIISFDINGISEEIDAEKASSLANFNGFELVKESKKADPKEKEKTEEKDLKNLNVSDIKKLLDEKKIKYPSRANKEELLELLK